MAVGVDPWGELDSRGPGYWSKTFLQDRSTLGTGKQVAQKSEPGTYNYVGTGEGMHQSHGNGEIVTLSNYSWNITSWNGSKNFPNTIPLYFNNCAKVVLENLVIRISDSSFKTIDIIYCGNCDEVYVRNLLLIGGAASDSIKIRGHTHLLIDNIEVRGLDYGSGYRCGRGIYVLCGENDTLVTNKHPETTVVQNFYCHHSLAPVPSGYQGGLELMSPGNGLVYNGVIEQWDSGSGDSIPFQCSTRMLPTDLHGNGVPYGDNQVCRVERLIYANPTTSKDVYIKQGAHGSHTYYWADTQNNGVKPNNAVFFCNNIFMDSKIAEDICEGQDHWVNNLIIMDAHVKQMYEYWKMRTKFVSYNNIFYFGSTNPGYFMVRKYRSDIDVPYDFMAYETFTRMDYDLIYCTNSLFLYQDQVNGSWSRSNLAALQSAGQEVHGQVETSGSIFANYTKGVSSFDFSLDPAGLAAGAGGTDYINHSDIRKRVAIDFNGNGLNASAPDLGPFQVTEGAPPPPTGLEIVIDDSDADYSSSAGFTTLGGGGSGGEVIDMKQENALSPFRRNSSTQIIAQDFVTSVVGEVSQVVLKLVVSGSPSGNMWIEIWDDSGGQPGSTQIGGDSSIITCAQVAAGGEAEYTFTWSTNRPVLAASTHYHFLLTGDASLDSSNYVNYRYASAEPIAGLNIDRYDGSSWVDYGSRGFYAEITTAETGGSGPADAINGECEGASAGTGTESASWTFTLPATATFEVEAFIPTWGAAGTQVTYSMSGIASHPGFTVSQQIGQGGYKTIFTSNEVLPAGDLVITVTDDSDGVVLADAMRVSYTPASNVIVPAASADAILDTVAPTVEIPDIGTTYTPAPASFVLSTGMPIVLIGNPPELTDDLNIDQVRVVLGMFL